jgi:hypothetical protein
VFDHLKKRSAEINYSTLALEIIVVMVGILIAFQIDRWGEERRERAQEHQYLSRLKEDLQFEIGRMDMAMTYANARLTAVLLLEELAADPSAAMEQPNAVPMALETATWLSFPQISAFVYTELQSTGGLAFLRSQSLRRDLANYYTTVAHESRIGLDLNLQHLFDRLTAGILTTSELTKVEEFAGQDKFQDVSASRALEIAKAFAARQEAVDLLPNIAQYHVFNQKIIESYRRQALIIIEEIESLLNEIEN